MPISSHCFCPWASSPARLPATDSSPSISSTWSTSGGVRSGWLTGRTATSRLSRTLRLSKTLGTWNFRAMPRRAKWCSGRPTTSCPSNLMRPPDGRRDPHSILKNVLLPAPFGPMIERSSSRMTVKSTPATAATPPNCRLSPRTSRSGSVMTHLATVCGCAGAPGAPGRQRPGCPSGKGRPSRRRRRP